MHAACKALLLVSIICEEALLVYSFESCIHTRPLDDSPSTLRLTVVPHVQRV